MDRAALRRVADGIRAHHGVVTVDAWARVQHAILRIERAVWVGADAYIVFSVHNRASAPLRLRAVTVHVDGKARPGIVSFPDAARGAEHGLLGTVLPRGRQTGVLVLREATRWAGELVSVHALPRRAPGERGPRLAASFVLRR